MTKTVCRGKLRSIDMASSKRDSSNSNLVMNPDDDLEAFVRQYDTVFQATLDLRAREVERTIILRPHFPWYSD